MLRVLDLFSGIGGFSLGLERAGKFRTVAFCEIDAFCRKVLAKHWPEIPCYRDVRELTADKLAADGIGVDVICGGFPCQDISLAGKGAGMAGERSGLWSEFARLIGELRPRYAIVENVSALLSRGFTDVLGDLVALGYDAEWHCIPASAVGAPHRRDRVWIVAYTIGNSRLERRSNNPAQIDKWREFTRGSVREDVPDANGAGRIEQWQGLPIREELAAAQCNDWWLVESRMGDVADGVPSELARRELSGIWGSEPDIPRVATGIRNRMDKLRALGNAVVPQIPELIGKAIVHEWSRTQKARAAD